MTSYDPPWSSSEDAELAASVARLKKYVATQRSATSMPYHVPNQKLSGDNPVSAELHEALIARESLRVDNLIDEHARLQRRVEVLQQIATASPSKPSSDVAKSVEAEMILLRRVAEEELHRLQARAANDSAAIVSRARLRGVVLLESAEEQAKVRERSLRSALKVAQQESTAFQELRQTHILESEACAKKCEYIQELAQRIRSQETQFRSSERALQVMHLRREKAEEDLRIAKEEHAETRRGLQRIANGSYENALQQHLRPASTNTMPPNSDISLQVAQWHLERRDMEDLLATRKQDIRRERRQRIDMEREHDRRVAAEVAVVESRMEAELALQQKPFEEQASLFMEEVALLQELSWKLRLNLDAKRAHLATAKARLSQSQKNSSSQICHKPSKKVLVTESQMQAVRAEDMELRRLVEVRLREEEEHAVLRRGCEAISAALGGNAAGTSRLRDFCIGDFQQEYDAAFLAFRLHMEENMERHIGRISKEYEDRKVAADRDLATLGAEQIAARAWEEVLLHKSRSEAMARATKERMISDSLGCLGSELREVEDRLSKAEETALELQSERQRAATTEFKESCENRDLQAAAAALSTQMLDLEESSRQSSLELQEVESELQQMADVVAQEASQVEKQHDEEETSMQSLALVENEALALAEEIDAENLQMHTLKTEAGVLNMRNAECERSRIPITDMRQQIADLHEQLEGLLGEEAKPFSRTSDVPKRQALSTKALTPRGASIGGQVSRSTICRQNVE